MTPLDRHDVDPFEYARQLMAELRDRLDDRTRELQDTIERRHRETIDTLEKQHEHRKANAEMTARAVGKHELALHPERGWVQLGMAALRADLDEAVSQKDGAKGWVTVALAGMANTQTWLIRGVVGALITLCVNLGLILIGDAR